jgi:putative ABC transport system ATP-binding protein
MDIMSTNERGGHFIELHHVGKRYGSERALDDVDLVLRAGEFIAVVGKSGSGKSTLLNLVAGLDRPSEGTVTVGGTAVHALTEDALAAWRGASVGVVFQFFQLLPTLTVLENVMLPMDFRGQRSPAEAEASAKALLAQMGIPEQADKLPSALSGGQQQRAAIARALANNPQLIVADEPTGNLDSQTARAVMELLAAQARAGKTVLLVTHERDFSELFDRVITLADGRVLREARRAA